MSGFRKLIAFFLAILFILAAIPVLIYFPAKASILNETSYISLLEEKGFYDLAMPWLGELAVQSISTGSADLSTNILAKLSEQDYQQIFGYLFPTNWQKQQTVLLADQVFQFINLERDSLTLEIDFREVKTRLKSPESQGIAEKVINSWAPCTAAEINLIQQAFQTGDLKIAPFCKPNDAYLTSYTTTLNGVISGFSQSMPDLIDLTQMQGNDINQLLSSSDMQTYRMIRKGFDLAPMIAGALLLLLAIVTISSWSNFLRWIGIPLLVIGLVGLAIGFLMGVANNFFFNSLQIVSQGLTTKIIELLVGIVKSQVSQFAIYTGLLALGVFLTGLMMAALGYRAKSA